MQKVLIDGRQFILQHSVEKIDDSGIALHGNLPCFQLPLPSGGTFVAYGPAAARRRWRDIRVNHADKASLLQWCARGHALIQGWLAF
jgi:hypothetical protein